MLRIGWARRDITPQRPAMLQGQMHRRIASTALDPLTVTALALEAEDGADGAVIVSCDLTMTPESLWQATRQRLASRLPGFPPDRIILAATHTHTSLVIDGIFYEHPGGEVLTPAEGEVWVAEKITEAVAEAWENRKPGLVGHAFGHAVVGHNRYALYADGHAQMYGPTNREDFIGFGGYEDHSLDMLFTWEPEGRLVGMALAIPCPAQVDEGLEQFSADYWHDVRLELRRRWGTHLQVLGLCSPAGDQSPHFLLYGPQERMMRQRRGLTERQEIAQRVADAVERALACTGPETGMTGPLAHRVRRVALPPRQVTQAERDWAHQAREQWISQHGEANSWWPQRLQRVVDTFEGRVTPEPVPVELHFLRVGEVAIGTSPFELFLDYGLQIKARSPATQTVLIQLAGHGWYLPTERAVRAGGYGAMPAVSRVGPEGGRELVRETLSQFQQLFPEASEGLR
jgi:hypothetical protein